MNAIVPDTLQGAVIISIIDFFLSFVIISGIGVVLAFFPVLNRVAKYLEKATSERRSESTKPAAPAAQTDHEEADQADIAAISAAIFVIMSDTPHRIIKISPSNHGAAWKAEGRIAQHGSHATRF